MSPIPNFANVPLRAPEALAGGDDRSAWQSRLERQHQRLTIRSGTRPSSSTCSRSTRAEDLRAARAPRHAARACRRSCAAPTRRCTSSSRGPSASTPASRPPRTSNAFYRRNLAAGQKGLSIAFDLATHRGYDSRSPARARRRGHGRRRDRLDPRHAHPVRPHPARSDERVDDHERRGAAVLALYIVAAEEQGVPPEKLSGTIQNDILKEFMVRNTYIYPPDALDADHRRHLRVHVEAHAEVQQHHHLRLPHAGGRRDGGPRARLHARRRPRVPAHRPRSGPRHRQLRAAALVLLGDRHELLHGGREDARGPPAVGRRSSRASSPRSAQVLSLRTHCQTSGWSLTAQDPFNNVARTCIEAMAASPGHTQSLHTNALDEALALPTDFSARIARNTQLFLQQETGICRSDRSLGRQLLRRAPHPRPRAARLGAHRRGRGARRHGQGDRGGLPKLRIEEAAARTQARIDSGQQTDRRRQQASCSREEEPHRGPQGRQQRRARGADRAPRRSCASERDERRRAQARSTRSRTAADERARATCSRSRSTRRARAPASARSATRSRRSGAATRPRSAPSPGVY